MILNRWFLLLFILPGLFGISGCSEGETIPLVPAGNICERPLDGNWINLMNICGARDPEDTVWPEGGMPVIVGERGLIAESRGKSEWSLIDLSIRDDLLVVTSDDDGNVMAAGENGALASRRDGIWQTMDSPAETTWRDIRISGDQIWLAGDHGSLAKGTLDGAWEMVDFPDSTDLQGVCAFEDSVYVVGEYGLLKVLVDNQWHDCPTPEQRLLTIKSIVRLDDGRLVIFDGDLWVREADGWVEKDDYRYGLECHLKVHDGFLWYLSYYVGFRLDPSSEPWGRHDYDGYGNPTSWAPGPDTQAFVVARDGEFTWTSPGPQNVATGWIDPAGYLETSNLFRLADGSVVFPIDNGLFQITPRGLEQVSFQSPDANSFLRDYHIIDGASVGDFYTVAAGYLRHYLNGAMVMEEPIPEEVGSYRYFRVNSSGQVCMTSSNGVLFWNGDLWETWLEQGSGRVTLTADQKFLATSGQYAVYQADGGLATFHLGIYPELVWELEPGMLGFLDDGFCFRRWKVGTEIDSPIYLDPLPGCTSVYPRDMIETPTGALVSLSDFSMVLKFPEDPIRADWNLVAGPCFNQISDLEILEDGSLVALDNTRAYIMAYPSPGF